MRTILLTFLALTAFASEADIIKAEKSWAAAVVARDYAVLDRLFSDQLIYAHSTGAIESKAEYTGRLKKGAQKYDGIEHQKITVKMHGDAAVAHCLVRMHGTSNGKPFDDRLMMLHLWVKQGGQWRLAAHQTTKLE